MIRCMIATTKSKRFMQYLRQEKISIDIVRHWLPDIRQTSTKHAYVAEMCHQCRILGRKSKRSFRLNLKLNVFKCYQCGSSGKSTKQFVNITNIVKKNCRRRARNSTTSKYRIRHINQFVNPEIIYDVKSKEYYEMPF